MSSGLILFSSSCNFALYYRSLIQGGGLCISLKENRQCGVHLHTYVLSLFTIWICSWHTSLMQDLPLTECKFHFWLPWWHSGKEPACQCRRHRFNPWVGEIPWRRKWQSTPVFLPGESHGQRILTGYSPWGCKELNMAEQLDNKNSTSRYKVPWPQFRA